MSYSAYSHHDFDTVTMTSEDVKQFYDYFYNFYDALVSESPNTSFLVGDVNPTGNGFYPKAITRHSKLKQIIKDPTRGSNIHGLVFTDTSAMFESPTGKIYYWCSKK